ncbi:MAG: right-handed parallel beta-helix repeat-containing protein [Phycisphaerae bacterium]|nr:right-handed parallel beta-helix repeat-containing protein [Phycisphaerae bacterium]
MCGSCLRPSFAAGEDANATRITVRPSGDDGGTGSEAMPFRTLHRAQQAARERLRQGTGHVVVELGSGIYPMERPLTLTEEDSGGPDATVTYRGADGIGSARLLGSVPVVGWEEYRDGIWQVSLPEGVLFHTLYENGRRAHKARFPNHEHNPRFPCARERYLVTEDGTPKGNDRPGNAAQGPGWLRYPAEDPPPSLRGSKAKLLIYLGGKCDWTRSMFDVRSIDPVARELGFEAKTIFGGVGAGARFFLEDDVSFLDVPGEFHLDDVSHVLYYKPMGTGHPDMLDIRRPVVNRIIEIRGSSGTQCASSIRIEGLSVEQTDCVPQQPAWAYSGHTDGALIWLRNAAGVVIRNCHLRNGGRHGIMVVGHNTGHVITGCRIEHMGLNGVSFANRSLAPDGKSPTEDRCEGNRVHNTHIGHVGEIHTYAECITVFHASHNEVDHCVLENSVRYAITVRGNTGPQYGPPVTNNYPPSAGNHFHHLRVSRCGQDGGDMGALHCANLNNPGGGSVNTFEQITVADTWAVPSMKDIGCDGIFLDWPRMAMDQVFRNVHIVRSQGKQLRSHGVDNGASAQTHNVSWKPGFRPELMDYADIGLTAAYPAEFGGRDTPASPPPPPRRLAAETPAHHTVVLVWEAPEYDFRDVPRYTVYREGASIACVGEATFIDTGLQERTAYRYEVAAQDGDFSHPGPRTGTCTVRTPADRIPPTVQGAWVMWDGLRVRVLFSKAMDGRALRDPSNYQFSPALAIEKADDIGPESVELTVGGFDPAKQYALTLRGLRDGTASGNALHGGTAVAVAVTGKGAYYPMRPTAAGSLLDCGGGAGDARLVGGAAIVAGAGPFGGPALVLDGETGYAEASKRLDFGDGDFTIMLWMMREGGGHVVLSKGNGFGSAREWSFGWPGENRNRSVALRVNNRFHSTAAEAVPVGTWVHVAFVRRGRQGFSYVNGERSAGPHDLEGAGPFANEHPLRIGRRAHEPDPQYFKGRIAEVRLFGYALPDDDIRALAKGEHAGPGEGKPE